MAKVKLSNLGVELREYLKEVSTEVYAAKEKGLEEAADFMADKLKSATPVNSGSTKASWEVEKKYKGVKYIYNTKLSSQNIPIVNLLEYSKKGKPFVRKTFNQNESRAVEIVKNNIEKGV